MSIVAVPLGGGRWELKEEKSLVISLKMKESDIQKIDRMALELGCSRSSLIRMMIKIGYDELERLIGRLDEMERIVLGSKIDRVDSLSMAGTIISYLRLGRGIDETVRILRREAYGEAEEV